MFSRKPDEQKCATACFSVATKMLQHADEERNRPQVCLGDPDIEVEKAKKYESYKLLT